MIKKFNFLTPFICFLLGAISTFSLEPYSIYPLIFCFSLGFHLIFNSEKRKQVVANSWSFSFGWFFSGLYWIGAAFFVKSTIFYFLMPFAIILLPAILAFIWTFGFICVYKLKNFYGNKFFWIIIILSSFEFLRGYILEFPWLMPAYFFASNELTLQSFSFLGSYGMNIIFLTIVVVPNIFLQIKTKYIKSIFFLIIPLLSLFYFSYQRHENKTTIFLDNYLVSLVQPNIKQKDKWKKILTNSHYDNLLNLSNSVNNNSNDLYNLIIWPETSFLGVFPRDRNKLLNLSNPVIMQNSKNSLITGVIHYRNYNYYNSAVLINSKNKVEKVYDKNFLVPFGEYIPFKRYLPRFSFLSNKVDFSKGEKKQNLFVANELRFIPLICYEIIFSKYIFKQISDQTQLIVNITNDAWFGNTIGPYQHLQFAKIRAVEFGISVARVANTGISAYFDPYGKMVSEIKLNEKGDTTNILIQR